MKRILVFLSLIALLLALSGCERVPPEYDCVISISQGGLRILPVITSTPASDVITVGEGRQYTSFTRAVYETVDSGLDIVVYPGTYDIRKEYADLFSLETLNDATDLSGFQFGIRLHDRRVLFLPGSRLVCVWYFPTDYSARFCPLYTGPNTVLDGLDLYAEGTEYAIHDDIWRYDAPYVNEFHHCRVIGKNLYGANCIGGGVTRNSRIIIDNCYFDNGFSDSVTVRYHNTDYTDAAGDIWISNTYFNAFFAACSFGETSHLNVYVNGCKASRIAHRMETEGTDVVNVDLYKWNNDETAQ